MTCRELFWMASARKEIEGEYVAALVQRLHLAVWAPEKLPKDANPFREQKPVSEAMRKHLEKWAARRWRVSTGG